MASLYRAYRELFAQMDRRDRSALRREAADPARIEALRVLKDRLQQTASAIEAAVFELQNGGETNPALSRALSIANHCAAGAAQLLVAALDGGEQIRAASAQINAAADALDAIKANGRALIDRIDDVTGVLVTTGRMLELITP